MAWRWDLDLESCTGCGICRDVCPEEAIRMTREMALPEPIPGACTSCGHCRRECPFDAITVHRESTNDSDRSRKLDEQRPPGQGVL